MKILAFLILSDKGSLIYKKQELPQAWATFLTGKPSITSRLTKKSQKKLWFDLISSQTTKIAEISFYRSNADELS